ncbi:MAG: UDP-N-acetylmuramoyl-tripeptide--D-alanyl-D-alanine ligase [candidate division Zixibacteria bacterium]|nr:UDP-N-acetylmuramoyl-tripeptide--D-alanyl-D-alanine ligase [candidate division Zixibacteria bacterium]
MSFAQLARMLGGRLYEKPGAEPSFTGISIDSRTLRERELFFALRGGKYDGHDYIDQALQKGAAGVVVETTCPGLDKITGRTMVVAVTDSHEALLKLAFDYRNKVRAQYLVVTGSNGKTTTKELIYYLLTAVTEGVYRSPGNLNNLYGLPLSIFSMPHETKTAVMELGISVPGEMTRLAHIVRPDMIIITNVGPTHLETLGTVEGVARAKLELVREAAPDVTVIINGEDRVLLAETKKIKNDFITFGLESEVVFKPDRIEQVDGGNRVTVDGLMFNLPLFGRYQVYNFMAAYAAVKTLGYVFDDVDTSTITFQTAPMRGQFVEINGVTFISDCYNANPESVKGGLVSFAAQRAKKRRIIILGDMLELGAREEELHREIGRLLSGQTFDRAVLVGPLAKFYMDELVKAGIKGDKIRHIVEVEAAAAEMLKIFEPGDLVYIKGSRGIGLEKIMDVWKKRGGNA